MKKILIACFALALSCSAMAENKMQTDTGMHKKNDDEIQNENEGWRHDERR